MKTMVASAVLMIGIVLLSCRSNERITRPPLSETDTPLQGVTWSLASFESSDGVITPLPDTETIVITFKPDGSFDGHTTVNTYGGPYVSDSRQKTVKIQYIISTRAEGGPYEARFHDGLRRAARYRATSDGEVKRLKLFCDDDEALNFVGL